MIESLALLDADGNFVWADEHAPWGLCHHLILGTPAWNWVSSENVEAVKTAYSRCIVLREPQNFIAEMSIDGRTVEMSVWLRCTDIDSVRIVAAGVRLPSRLKNLTATEKDVLRLIGDGVAPKEIANQLDVERTTIDTHRRNIMQKLRIDDSHKLQAFATRKRSLW